MSFYQSKTNLNKKDFFSNKVYFLILRQFNQEIFGGYTIIWSTNMPNEDTFFSNFTLVEGIKASKIRFTMTGYYSMISKDIRKLYYAINEIRVRGR